MIKNFDNFLNENSVTVNSDVAKFLKLSDKASYKPVVTQLNVGNVTKEVSVFYTDNEFIVIAAPERSKMITAEDLVERGLDSITDDYYVERCFYPNEAYNKMMVMFFYRAYEIGESLMNKLMEVINTNDSNSSLAEILPHLKKVVVDYVADPDNDPLDMEFLKDVGYTPKELAPRKYDV